MTKRICALALALIMIFALSSLAFAEDISVNTRATDGTRTNSTNLGPGLDGTFTPGTNVPGTTPDNTFNRMNTNNNFYNNDGTGLNGTRNNTTTDLNGVRDGVRDGNRGMMTNNLRTRATTTNGMGWGWLGILGLIGLAGMSGRNRVTDRDR